MLKKLFKQGLLMMPHHTKSLVLAVFALFVFSQSHTQAQQKPAIQQAKQYHHVDDISQYWLSEKLDGIRGYWDGQQLLTRQGNVIYSPDWFTQHWPSETLDGELWIARDSFQQTLSCVRKVTIDESCWASVRFMIFDLPSIGSVEIILATLMSSFAKSS